MFRGNSYTAREKEELFLELKKTYRPFGFLLKVRYRYMFVSILNYVFFLKFADAFLELGLFLEP